MSDEEHQADAGASKTGNIRMGRPRPVDRLSILPESLIVHILSYLPTHEAVKTMLICKSFTTLWTWLPSLHLEDCYFDSWDDLNPYPGYRPLLVHDLPFFIFVRNLLMHHKTPKIDSFTVDISTMTYSEIHHWKLGHEIQPWIDFALRKQVKKLDLTFFMMEPDELKFIFPSELISDSLVELRLEFLDMSSLSRLQLRSLRILRLIRVEISDDMLGAIISRCPLLKELEIKNCFDLDQISFDAPNVEKLTVDISEFAFIIDGDEDFGRFITINCPNIKSFDFIGFLERVEFKNLSSLIDVTYYLHCRRDEFNEFSKFIALVKKFVCAERVSFSTEFVTILLYCMLKDPSLLSKNNWKHANFSMRLINEKHIHGLNYMLRSLPHLEELVLNITNSEDDFIKSIEAQFEDDVLRIEDCWTSLKCITIRNIANSSYPILVRLTELLLRKASDLNQLEFHYGWRKDILPEETCNLTLEELSDFTQKLPTFLKASQHVRISCVNRYTKIADKL